MIDDFYRIGRLPPYVFAEVNRLKAKARSIGEDIIDLGMGNPDSPTPPHIVEKLIETVKAPRVHGYSMSRGIPGLRKALSGYYNRRFNVDIDPETEALVTLGSKEGLASLATAITGSGEAILVPSPNYPIHTYGFVIAGADVRHFPFGPGYDFITELKEAIRTSPKKPLAVVVNFPCNPTAEVKDLAFYEELVDVCKYHGIYILSDLAYCDIYFDDAPPSILQVKGAKDIAVEFTTVSKTYSMAGWRIGFMVGNKTLIAATTKIKSYLDYGAFTPVQVAAATALNGPQDCVDEFRKLYKERRDVLVKGLREAGWNVPMPSASMFVWAPLPEQFKALGSLEFSKRLLQNASVAVSPGVGFGEYGEGYVRIAMVENKHRIRQAVRNIKHYLHEVEKQGTGALIKQEG